MTLTEFVLARIGEDEMAARLVEDGPGEVMRRGLDPLRITMADAVVRFAYLTIDPARVLAECEAKRRIIADLSAERHEVVDDCWYTCSAATEERDGGQTCDDSRLHEECDCGRDTRVLRRLGILALPYADHADYLPEWRT